MIGGAATFNYYCRLDRFKLNLAGQELKEKRLEDYQKICSDLDKRNLCVVNEEKKIPSLSNAILSFYDALPKDKYLKVKLPDTEIIKPNNSPDELCNLIDELWREISNPTTAFLKQNYTEPKRELLKYNDVKKELKDPIMTYAQRDQRAFIIKELAALIGLAIGIPKTLVNPFIGVPLTIGSGALGYDVIRQLIASSKYEKKGNFTHVKEFRDLLHCARQTDKYMTKDIDLTPPGRPIALGSGRNELENEAIEIRKKLKKQK